ncbi:MAG: hypothetical protein J6Z31_01135 [Fibrobacter sp.]|nr:hypothetical protein [Fibrobacter sp.]
MTRLLAFCKSPFALCILFVLGLGVLNLKVQYAPELAEWSRERAAVKEFDAYWNSEGAKKFKDVGVEPTDKIYKEELEAFLKKFHANNPTLVPEKRIAQMTEEFQVWWETTGKKSYAVNEVAPDEKLYKKELKRYIQGYTKDVSIYQLFFIPEDSSIASLFTCWFLFPGALSFVIFAIGFLFAMKGLEKRWGYLQSVIFLVMGTLVAGFAFMGTLPLSYFDRYANTPYMGMSLSLAMLLGIAGFGPKNAVAKPMTAGALAILVADVLTNWNANANLYGWVAILEVVFFGIGAALGIHVPRFSGNSKASTLHSAQETVTVDPKVRTRKELKDAIDLANKAEYDHASQILLKYFGLLFRENPLDVPTIEKTVEAMLYPHYFFPIPGMIWMSWGSEAAKKKLPKIAADLYEKGISVEQDKKILRRGLFYVGDLRLREHLDEDKGREALEKVIQMDSTDILAEEARKLLLK